MSESAAHSRRGIRAIFHPSDFSAASEVAFAHALKIALMTHGSLSVLHVAEHGRTEWTDSPVCAIRSSAGSSSRREAAARQSLSSALRCAR